MSANTPPADYTERTEDLSRPPGPPAKSSYFSLLLSALGALGFVGGIAFLLLIYSPSFNDLVEKTVALPSGGKELMTVFGGIIVAAGVILLTVAVYSLYRTMADFRNESEWYRVAGVATKQAIDKLRPPSR